jgi:hypothetical protein
MWRFYPAYRVLPAVAYVSEHLATYVEYPRRQKPGSFNLERVLDKLQVSACLAFRPTNKIAKALAAAFYLGSALPPNETYTDSVPL